MGKLKRLAGETILYGFGSIVPRFLNFLLVRLHTDVFGAEQYGVITKLFAYVAVINTIFMFGMETAYFRFANKEGADERRIFNLTQTVVLAISGISSLILLVFARPVADYLNIPTRPDIVIWLVLIMFIDAAVAIPFAHLRFYKKAFRFAIGKLVNVVILVFLNIFFLKLMETETRDVGFVVLANLIANAFYILFVAPMLFRWRPAYDRELTPSIFQYSFPILITGLAGMTNEMFSRISLEKWLPEGFYGGKSNDYAVGIFGGAYKFAVLMNLGIQAFRYAAEPFFFASASEKNSPQLFARINHYFVIVCCIVLLGVSINLDILKHFLKRPEFWEGLHLVPILLVAYLFLGIYYNFSVWFKLSDKTYYGTIITIVGAVITIGGNYLLIPIWGYDGSAWAAFACYFIMTVLCYIYGQKYYPIPYNIAKLFAYIAVTIFLCYAVNSISISNQWAATGFHVAVMIVYVAVIYLLERKDLVANRA